MAVLQHYKYHTEPHLMQYTYGYIRKGARPTKPQLNAKFYCIPVLHKSYFQDAATL